MPKGRKQSIKKKQKRNKRSELFISQIIFLLKVKKNLSGKKALNFFYVVHFLSSSSSSSVASKTLNPSPKSHPIAEYLISSCGFSSRKAAAASKSISKLTSVEQAHSVRHFFKHRGFTDTSVSKLISNYSRILCGDVEKTLRPNLQALRDMGFTEAELQLLVTSHPYVLATHLAIPRLEFWQNIIGTNNRKDLVLVFTRNRGLITQDIVTDIAPKISLLKVHGLSQKHIIGIVKRGHGLMMRSCESIEMLLQHAKELGFDPKFPMFGQALSSLSSLGSGTIEEKMEFFKGFGWSEKEFYAALKKAPFFIHLSNKNVLEKMDFLAGRAGCKQSYISSNPVLLMFSLDKRLKPRHYVMEMLKSNESIARWDLYYVMCLPEMKFVETFILPYVEQVPEVHKIYISACAGQMQL